MANIQVLPMNQENATKAQSAIDCAFVSVMQHSIAMKPFLTIAPWCGGWRRVIATIVYRFGNRSCAWFWPSMISKSGVYTGAAAGAIAGAVAWAIAAITCAIARTIAAIAIAASGK